MFRLFSSNYSTRFLRNTLSALAYPAGHVVRFRYARKYVHPAVTRIRRASSGTCPLRGFSTRALTRIPHEGPRMRPVLQ